MYLSFLKDYSGSWCFGIVLETKDEIEAAFYHTRAIHGFDGLIRIGGSYSIASLTRYVWTLKDNVLYCRFIGKPHQYDYAVISALDIFPNVRLDCGALEESTMFWD